MFVPYDAVFDDGPTTFEHFKQVVKSLSRTDTLFWCARLNLILADSNAEEKAKQQYCLDCFFTSQQIQSVNKFVNVHSGSDCVSVLHRGTLLELIRWVCLLCVDHPNDGETFNRPEVRALFAQVLLMANDLWGKRVYRDSAFQGTSIGEKRTNALASIRYSLTETRCDPRPFEALARGAELFGEIVPKFYADFLEGFNNITGLLLAEYYLCLCTIMAHHMNSEAKSGVGRKEESGIFTMKGIRDSAPHMEAVFEQFLAVHTASPDELALAFWPGTKEETPGFDNKYSLKPLRERPILKAADGRMIILDPVCFAETASIGPLFHVLSHNNQNRLFAAFGYAFEEYVRRILQRIYPESGSHLARRLYSDVREAKDNGIQITDFMVDDVTDLVAIEAKAIWIKDEKMSQDAKAFAEHLCSRYGGEDRDKGYTQLARSIRKMSTQEWQPVKIDLTQSKRVYPVLLIHDALLDAPVFGHFLAAEFRHQLQPDSIDAGGWMVKGRFNVAPLTIMTIDDLECLESSLSKFTLVDLLKAYSGSTPDRLVSLNNFLALNPERFPLVHNKSLASGCETILAECMRRVFPMKEAID